EPLGWVIGTGIYMDDVDKFIAREKAYLNQQIWQLIVNISIFSLISIVIFVLLYYAISRYFYPVDSTVNSTQFWEEIGEKELVESSKQSLPSENSIEIAKELSKIMLAEQTKLLAYTATLQAANGCQNTQDSKIAVGKLTSQVHDMAENVQKMTVKVEPDD
ncbi:MAG: hypothetical protein KAG43_10595, partial [Candidatus Marithrix sp.]|nr:hypothetical protein [Candidatus Marithrix sp.]